MPTIVTKQFGALEYAEDGIFEFPLGLLGFEAAQQFLCIERPAMRPIVFLQSIENPELCFITLPAKSVDPNYELAVASEDIHVLGMADATNLAYEQSLACLAIVCLPAEGFPTANLLGPVVLSRETRRGVQSVRDDRKYSAVTPLRSSASVASPAASGNGPGERFVEV